MDINLKKKWTVYILQHSHTDIGYTDRQEEITAQHVSYIREALDILDSGQYEGFKWICEGLWGVEEFWDSADARYRDAFIRHVKSGGIGLSGNYLNLNESVSEDVLRAVMSRAHGLLAENGLKASCAMTADINGYSWGYADILAGSGVDSLMSFVHTHHGGDPFGKTQTGFWWQGPGGNRILSWVGEHYNMGNWTGLCPEYGKTSEEWLSEAVRLLPPYLEKLGDTDYPFDFCPIAVSGMFSDNAPPNADIALLVRDWNSRFGGDVLLKMATLDEFFSAVRDSGVSLPVHKGDWTDWWADGMASTPLPLKMYRDAQRKYSLIERLDPEKRWVDEAGHRQSARDLVLYAEHTWGYSASVSAPWEGIVNELDARKSAYASNAHTAVCKNLDAVLTGMGKQQKRRGGSLTYTVYNPWDEPVSDYVDLLYNYENERHENVAVLDTAAGQLIPHQGCYTSRARGVSVALTLQPREKRVLKLVRSDTPAIPAPATDWSVSQDEVRTPFHTLRFSGEAGGLTSVVENRSGIEFVRSDRGCPAFMPIYEVTPAEGDYMGVRGRMVHNRRSDRTLRYFGKLNGITVSEAGALRSRLKLSYALEGTSFFEVEFSFYRDVPRFDVSVRLHKDSVWDPENLYLALPFNDEGDELWIEKTGCVLRPGIDQLPGSCIDFYALQEGMAFTGGDTGIALSSPDAPMIWLGELNAHPYTVYEGKHEHNRAPLYSWLMNNFWETNFKAALGGFYEFNYRFASGAQLRDPAQAIKRCGQNNLGLTAFRSE